VCDAFRQFGQDALGKLAGGVEPTLIAILSDINMPGTDGLDLLGEVKRRYASDDGDRLWRRRAPASRHRIGRGRVSYQAGRL
jgi:CheY-like chemotaxis protein